MKKKLSRFLIPWLLRLGAAFVIMLALFSTSAALAQEAPAQPSPSQPTSSDSNVILHSGERLDIFVLEDPSLNGCYQVRRGGYIIIPAVGRVSVAGQSLSKATEVVRKAIEATQP